MPFVFYIYMYISKHFIQAPNYSFTFLNATELPNSAHTISPFYRTGQSFLQETDVEESRRGVHADLSGPGRCPGGRGRTQLPPKASPQTFPRGRRGARAISSTRWGALAGGSLLPRKGGLSFC